MTYRLLAILVALYLHVKPNAQCVTPTPDPQGSCNTGTDIPLTEGANINSGQVYYFSGGPTTFSNISLNGGLLRVCGDLNVSNLAFNGGKIIIASTGSLNFTHSGLTLTATNQDITNYGSLTINAGFNINEGSEVINEGTMTLTTSTDGEGGSSLIYNAPGGIIIMAGLNANIGNEFINYGTVILGNMTVQGTGSVCMGSGAIIEADNLTNNTANSITAFDGTSCISYSGTATMNQQLTTSSNLIICKKSGASDPTGAGFGSATVINNCSSCLQTLPITLSSFTATETGGFVTLKWVTEMEDQLSKYVVEKASTGSSFISIAEINALNRPNTYTYTATIQDPSYFRLKIIEANGQFSYSRTLLVRPGNVNSRYFLLTNPVTNGVAHIAVYGEKAGKGQFILYDATGRQLKKIATQISRGNNFVSIPLEGLKPAIYTIVYINDLHQLASLRFILGR